jgi:rSAM/selenodomain-associated transferase 1
MRGPTKRTISGSPDSEVAGRALVFFAKAPRAGLVKTRLCPPLTPNEAAGLYRGFLADLLGQRARQQSATFAYVWPADGLDEVAALADPSIGIRPQRGADLWERMTACFDELFAEGYSRIVLRNTDSPDLPAEHVQSALAACRPGRVVLGPDAGGGYVSVGLAEPPGRLFAPGLDAEGAERVCARTRARARELGWEVHELPVAADVDEFADLVALWRRRGGGDRDVTPR